MALHMIALHCAAFTAPTFGGFTVQRAASTPIALRHRSMPAPLLQATPPPTGGMPPPGGGPGGSTPQPTPDEQQAKFTKLLVSILIDLIGVLTYAVPAIGEVGDLAWAPISALLIYKLYGNGLIAGSTCRKCTPVSATQLAASAS